MNNPLVTILSPCYNVEAYLPQCLDSIINQTYRNLQIVLIDDGSKDNTWNLMQEYAAKDSRIEIYHQENQGVASTRNNLLDKVKGDYVLFVDSDDWIEHSMIEFLLKKIVDHNAEIVTCGMIKDKTTISDDEFIEEVWNQDTLIKEFLAHVRISGSLWNKLIRSRLLQTKRIDTNCSYGEDALLLWRVIQDVKKLVKTDKQLYHYRMNDMSLSHLSWTPERKGSGSIVWRTIANEAAKWWPQYASIGQARYAIEDMWGLYYASLASYPYDRHIHERQINIRKNLKLIRTSGLVSKNKIFTACILAYCYQLGRFIKYTRK